MLFRHSLLVCVECNALALLGIIKKTKKLNCALHQINDYL